VRIGALLIDDIAPSARNVNRVRLLQALLHGPGRSRSELGRALGLSRATITGVLLDLERAGIVEQQAEGPDDRPRSNGRPPLQVSLAPSAAYAVGLDFGHRHVRAAVCDLGGRIVSDQYGAFDVDEAPLESFALAEQLAGQALAEAGVDTRDVIGVGVGLPAPIDAATGIVHADGFLPNWHGIRPARELEARLDLPVSLENDANAGAIGEQLFGAGRGVENLAYVQVSAGIGVSFADTERGGVSNNSTNLSFNGSACRTLENDRFCGRVARLSNSTSRSALVTSTSLGLDWFKKLDEDQTLQVSASVIRYVSDQDLGDNLKTHHFRLAGSYSRRINGRLSAGADVGVRALRRAGADPDTDVSGSMFVRYRLGDLG